METARLIIQWIIALGILNVWLVRYRQATQYRGGDAKNMQEEFAVYGLPSWTVYAVGGLKIALALALIAGTWQPLLVRPAALAMALLMAGAVAMHIKVRDPITKTLPALAMLGLSLFLVLS